MTFFRKNPDNSYTSTACEQALGYCNARLPILVVGTNEDVHIQLIKNLPEAYAIEFTSNNEAVVQKIIQIRPDLIIIEISNSPVGFQILHQIRRNTWLDYMPIIIISGKDDVETQIRALNYGANYFITKPFQQSMLVKAIKSLLSLKNELCDQSGIDKKNEDFDVNSIAFASQDEMFLKKIAVVVQTHIANPELNIEDLAKSIHMSRSPFFRKFKSITNMAPVEFIRERRLQKAVQILDTGESNMKSIAFQSGFSSVRYFRTCFKKRYKLLPNDYLNKKRIQKPELYTNNTLLS